MSLNSERKEITAVVDRLLDTLSAMVSSQTGEAGYSLRRQIGEIRAHYVSFLRDDTFTTELLNCFTIAREGNVSLANFVRVREYLFTESPVGDISKMIVLSAISFCLSAESQIIVGMEFSRRDDVESTIKVMKVAFDQAREIAADMIDSKTYQTLTFLAGALTNYLSGTALQLPREVIFDMPMSLPALALSQRIYYDASRWDELIRENQIVNPAFCPRHIKGLSA
jgi:hypothetical protein